MSLLSEAIDGAIRLDHKCTGFELEGGGVAVRFENGSTARGDVLIGADGIHSTIRAQLRPNEPLRYAGYMAWRCITGFDSAGLGVSETWGCGRRFGIAPMSGGRVYWFATKNSPAGGTDATGRIKQSLLELFGNWHDPIPALIRASDDRAILRNDIEDRDPIAHYGSGPVTLLGDAAHPMTPNLGQGGCQSIEDAVVLARMLASHSSPAAALRAYETQRTARTRQIVLSSRRAGAIGQIENSLACSVGDLVFGILPAGMLLRQLAPVAGYRGHLK